MEYNMFSNNLNINGENIEDEINQDIQNVKNEILDASQNVFKGDVIIQGTLTAQEEIIQKITTLETTDGLIELNIEQTQTNPNIDLGILGKYKDDDDTIYKKGMIFLQDDDDLSILKNINKDVSENIQNYQLANIKISPAVSQNNATTLAQVNSLINNIDTSDFVNLTTNQNILGTKAFIDETHLSTIKLIHPSTLDTNRSISTDTGGSILYKNDTPTGHHAFFTIQDGVETEMFRINAGTNQIDCLKNMSMNNNRLVSVAAPQQPTDAANKQYVDTAIANIPSIDTSDFVDLSSNQTISGEKTFNNANGVNAKSFNFIRLNDGNTTFNKIYIDEQGDINYQNLSGAGKHIFQTNQGGQLTPRMEISHEVNLQTSVNMNAHTIENLANPTEAQDAVNKSYVDNNFLRTDGTNEMFNDLNMNSQHITNVATPLSSSDAVNKSYVDTAISNIPSNNNNDISGVLIIKDGIDFYENVSGFSISNNYNLNVVNNAFVLNGIQNPSGVVDAVVSVKNNDRQEDCLTITMDICGNNMDVNSKTYMNDVGKSPFLSTNAGGLRNRGVLSIFDKTPTKNTTSSAPNQPNTVLSLSREGESNVVNPAILDIALSTFNPQGNTGVQANSRASFVLNGDYSGDTGKEVLRMDNTGDVSLFGNLNMNGHQINGIPLTPTTPTSIPSKHYVDLLAGRPYTTTKVMSGIVLYNSMETYISVPISTSDLSSIPIGNYRVDAVVTEFHTNVQIQPRVITCVYDDNDTANIKPSNPFLYSKLNSVIVDRQIFLNNAQGIVPEYPNFVYGTDYVACNTKHMFQKTITKSSNYSTSIDMYYPLELRQNSGGQNQYNVYYKVFVELKFTPIN